MSDDKRIIVDDDWKNEAQREKQRLAEETAAADGGPDGPLPSASFIELLNLLIMQALAGLGLVGGPGGERIPPNLDVAKHFIDMLQLLEEKTKGNLNAEEQKVLDQALYEIRMRYVQMTSGGGLGGMPPGAMPTA